MSLADRRDTIGVSARWLRSWPQRYGFAVGAVLLATALRYGLGAALGFSHVFTLFYLAILAVALLAGFGPGLMATFLSAGIAAYLFLPPPYSFVIIRGSDALGLSVFTAVGTAISWLAGLTKQRAATLQEFERVVEGLEEMIVVVDRHYRYRIANRAFLNYRGMKKEEVIGRRIEEILIPGVFEAAIKRKLDECFQGKIVQFEMRYCYPKLGERDLFISYFPIEGPTGIDRVACVLQDITERKESERSLKLFRTLIDHSNDAVEVVEPETLRFLDVNERSCRELGYTREELLSMTVGDIDPNVGPSTCQTVLERLGPGESVLKQTIHKRKDGSTYPVETSLKYVQLDRGYIIVVARNISERVKAEEALRESEDRYRDLVEHSEDLVCTHDLEGSLLSMNPAPARILGYEVAELLKMPMRELIAPECRDQFDDYLQRIRTAGADQGLLCVVTRNGERRIWEYNNTLRTEGVASPIVRGMAHDITERKRAEEALRGSEQRYRLLFEKNVAGVSISDMDGEIIECNEAGARILGYTAEEIRGRRAMEFFFDLTEQQPLLGKLKRDGSISSHEIRLRRKDGTPVWVLSNTVILAGGDAGTRVVQATSIDITERKRAEQAVRDAKEFSENLIQTANVIILGLDRDGNINLFNDAGAEITGYTFAELNGKSWSILVPRDRFPHVWAEFDRLLEDAADKTFENPILTKTGEERYISWRNSTVRVDGRVVATISFGNDITERRRAEESLRRSEENYRTFVERSSEGIFREDIDVPLSIDLPEDELVRRIMQDSYMAECNDAMARMYGFTSGRELVGKRLTEMLVNDDPRNIEMTREYIRSGFRVMEHESHEVDVQGNPKVFRNSMIGIVENGKLVCTWGIQRDVTEQVKAEEGQRKAEQSLVKSEERFRVALKDSPITVFNQDSDLRYTWIYNPQLYWQNQAIGKTDAELIGAKKAAALTDLKRRVLKTGVALRQEVLIPHDDRSYAFDITIEPLFDADGAVIGITGASMDIARLREMTDRLQDAKDKLTQEKSYLEGEIQKELGFEEIIGQGPALLEVLKNVRVVAPTDSTVLLLGETGTGKELVARSLHALSGRRDKTFIKLNCAAVPAGLMESELFGHEKGAFTSAVNQKLGRIELADKGTLFLDEIGELPLELQPKLLRVLQDREFERLGGVHTLHVDVRIISATNRDLRQDIVDKRFREDLFYRLNVFPIAMPALRERRTDIPILVHHFMRKHSVRMGKHIDIVPDETMAVLRNWTWPGNIRELENMIERMVILSKGRVLAALPVELALQEVNADNVTEMEREHIIRVLRETHGALSGADGAASRLGIKRTTLQSMLKRHGIELEDYRPGNGTFGAR